MCSRILMLRFSPHGVQVLVSPAFPFSVCKHSKVAEHIHYLWLFKCLSPGNATANAGMDPTTKASSEILSLVCLVPKHKLPLWRMGCLMETLLDCHGVLITFLMCQIPSDFKPHCRLYSAPLWPGLETVFSLVLHFRATWWRDKVTLSRLPRSW